MLELYLLDHEGQLVDRGTSNGGYIVWLEGDPKEYTYANIEPKEIVIDMINLLKLDKNAIIPLILTNFKDDNDLYQIEIEMEE